MKFMALIASLWIAQLANAAEFNSVALEKSSLSFVYKQMGVAVDGKFRKFAVRLAFDPAKPAAARAELDMELASIDAGGPEANEEVAGKLWFNTKANPQAKFVSTSVKPLGGNRYEVSGKMTLKGRTRDVSAPFTFTPQGNDAVFDGAFVLKRADFAIGEGMWADFGTVANEIQIKFRFITSSKK